MKIAPSILSADFANLSIALDQCERGEADQIHVDVMDGHFVSNITIGPGVVKDIRKRTGLPLDVHLMIENPEMYIPQFIQAGSDLITVHVETCENLSTVIRQIKESGAKAGVTLKPGTSLKEIENVISEVDLILIMSVEPGFGGQEFIPETLDRVRKIKKMIAALQERNSPEISVDGGVKLSNANKIVEAGADILVIGSAIFATKDPVKTMNMFNQIS
ncbi:MAG: ribulose-phosphate 3-epimerase [Candidatus Marinimicrobia bacterium]|nr:ribulose-phosphate 3-epimerase [Candidatus Neomarinimicrobiota bacterium]